jgi:hypothetical protein
MAAALAAASVLRNARRFFMTIPVRQKPGTTYRQVRLL